MVGRESDLGFTKSKSSPKLLHTKMDLGDTFNQQRRWVGYIDFLESKHWRTNKVAPPFYTYLWTCTLLNFLLKKSRNELKLEVS
jgi:hypothetical protein